jgi:hypothetical protein
LLFIALPLLGERLFSFLLFQFYSEEIKMKKLILLVLLTVFSISVPANQADLKEYSLVNSCNIFNLNGELKKSFPGQFCQFFDDGTYISADSNMKLLNSRNEIKWQINGPFHHQVNLSPDGKRILALATLYESNKTQLRYDRFLVLDLNGKVLQEQNSLELLKLIKIKHQYSDQEITHFNSFYEIPEITIKDAPDFIKAGNYILNSYKLGLFVLSSDMSKVLFHKMLDQSEEHQIHDAQILPSGNLIYFNNMSKNEMSNNNFSSIQEISLNNLKVEFEYTSEPKQMFFSRHCGGIQVLDEDKLLFSHMLTGTYIYSKKSKSIVSNIYQTHFVNNRFYPAQQVKAVKLKRFLSFWK